MHVTKANVTRAKAKAARQGIDERISRVLANVTRAKAKAARQGIDERISRVFMQNCSGIEIDITDIPKVFKAGRDAVSKHPEMSDNQLTAIILDFVNTIRKN